MMCFKVADKEVTLHGLSAPKNKIVGSPRWKRAAKKGREGILLQLYAVKASPEHLVHLNMPTQVQQILHKYKNVFSMPKGLPPARDYHHKIPLQSDQGPVSVRLYRYPYFQKTEIEELVDEMLSAGII
ncbi:hypothetical protein ACOSQ3_007020 [Xanthoceras sorbifolium]